MDERLDIDCQAFKEMDWRIRGLIMDINEINAEREKCFPFQFFSDFIKILDKYIKYGYIYIY